MKFLLTLRQATLWATAMIVAEQPLQQNTDLWTNLARVMDPNDPMQNLAIYRCWFNLKTHLEKSLISSQGVMQDTHQVELATFGSVLLNSQV
jgi:hypothetical protein